MSTDTPCPFCGNEATNPGREGPGLSWVVCRTCGAQGPVARTHTESLEFWNKRSSAAAGMVLQEPGTRIPAEIKVEATLTKRRG